MSVVVLVDGWDPAPWMAALKKAMPHEHIEAYPHINNPEAVEYALVWSLQTGVLDQFSGLKVLFSLGAGVDHLLQAGNLPDIPVARIVDPDLTSRMSEWVILQVLLHHRQQLEYLRLQSQGRWCELSQSAAKDVHVGIMGLGQLGRDSAEILHRLGFSMRGWSRTFKTIPNVESFHGAESLDSFLAGTDILVCLLPLTDETEGLIDKTLLQKLRADGPLGGPILINAGRGRIQVEDDIHAALENGMLKGASLDVFEVEPLPGGSPLWQQESLVITPHCAAVSNPAALSQLIARQIQSHRAAGTLEHVVDMEHGY